MCFSYSGNVIRTKIRSKVIVVRNVRRNDNGHLGHVPLAPQVSVQVCRSSCLKPAMSPVSSST